MVVQDVIALSEFGVMKTRKREVNKDSIVKWLRQYLKDARAKGYVVGLSGGVDSAVVAALAAEAAGKKRTLGVILPCGSSMEDSTLAQEVVEWLGIESKMVGLARTFSIILAPLPKAAVEVVLPKANLRTRLRMTVLYYFANLHGYLVAGTTNKSELSIGYFTKYGDGGVDVLPIGDLYKRQVYELARELGVPQAIIERAPTAGLWPGQTDEEELGMSYEVLDRVLQGDTKGVDRGLVKRVKALRKTAAHKLKTPPVYREEGQCESALLELEGSSDTTSSDD